jgi:hypothetical protein
VAIIAHFHKFCKLPQRVSSLIPALVEDMSGLVSDRVGLRRHRDAETAQYPTILVYLLAAQRRAQYAL